MSMQIQKLAKGKSLSRKALLKLIPPIVYNDGVTKQAYKDETDIVKIMARADKLGTISHLQKFEGVYADYSDFDFHEQTQKLTEGRQIFDELPMELRKEFGQSPADFFAYVNDPANKDDLQKKLPMLALPGKQLLSTKPPDADTEAAEATANPTPAEPAEKPEAATPDA